MLGIILLVFIGLGLLSILIPPLRAVVLLPIAMAQAWVREIAGDPYLPVVYKDPGREDQQLIAEHEEPDVDRLR